MPPPDLQLLFRTDAKGHPASFIDVIDDGLEGALDVRIPELLALLNGSEGKSAFNAGLMLLSWGHREAYQTLNRWSLQPNSVPWAGESITRQRHSGADGSWSLIADALRTSRYAKGRPGLDTDRLSGIRSLLCLTVDEDFERSLATTIASISGAAELLADELDVAIEKLISAGEIEQFDRNFQAALLTKELARARPQRARVLARQLGAKSPSPRAQREIDDLL
jgi:hypothetical protein